MVSCVSILKHFQVWYSHKTNIKLSYNYVSPMSSMTSCSSATAFNRSLSISSWSTITDIFLPRPWGSGYKEKIIFIMLSFPFTFLHGILIVLICNNKKSSWKKKIIMIRKKKYSHPEHAHLECTSWGKRLYCQFEKQKMHNSQDDLILCCLTCQITFFLHIISFYWKQCKSDQKHFHHEWPLKMHWSWNSVTCPNIIFALSSIYAS